MNTLASGKREKIMSTLFIPGGPETDSTNGAGIHVVSVLFVCLGVGTKLYAHMSIIVNVLSGEKVSW